MKSRTVTYPGHYELDFTPHCIELTAIDEPFNVIGFGERWTYISEGQYIEGTNFVDWVVKNELLSEIKIKVKPPGSHKLDLEEFYRQYANGTAIFGSGLVGLDYGVPKLDPETKPTHSCVFDQSYTGLIETFNFCKCGKKTK